MKEELLNKLKTKVIGKNIIYHKSIDSTQLEAKRIKNIVENGTIIITSNQTSGIGTRDRIWYMGKDENIAFTLILKPNCNISKINNLTTILAECMVKTVKKLYNINLQIKQPNDLMLNNKKIAGILTQASTKREIVADILVGIGMNINQNEFPEELKNIATSLKNEFNFKFNRIDIIVEFLSVFEDEYLKITT